MKENKNAKYILTSLLLLLLFNYPLLSTANKPLYVGEVPVLYVYIGIVWIVGIVVLYLNVSERRRRSRDE